MLDTNALLRDLGRGLAWLSAGALLCVAIVAFGWLPVLVVAYLGLCWFLSRLIGWNRSAEDDE